MLCRWHSRAVHWNARSRLPDSDYTVMQTDVWESAALSDTFFWRRFTWHRHGCALNIQSIHLLAYGRFFEDRALASWKGLYGDPWTLWFLSWQNLQKDLTLSNKLIRAKCQALASTYRNNLVADELVSELSQFRHYCHSHDDSEVETVGAAEQYSMLIADGVQLVFLNVAVARVLNIVVDSLLKSRLLSLIIIKSKVQW